MLFTIELGLAMIEAFFFYRLLGSTLTIRQAKWLQILTGIGIFIMCTMPILAGDLENASFVLIGLILIGSIVCTDTYSKRICGVFMIYALIITIKMLAARMQYIILPENIGFYSQYDLVLQAFIRVGVIALIYHILKDLIGLTKELISIKIWLLISVISFGIVVTVFTNMSKVSWDYSIGTSLMVILVMSTCILSIIAIFFIIKEIVKGTRESIRSDQLQFELEYYNDIEQNQEQTRKLLHDMKNHLGITYAMLYDEKIEEAKDYLRQTSGQLHETKSIVYCKHQVVNAILNNKVKKMKEYSIVYNLNFDLPETLKISDVDIGSILANTIDNAIEACIKMESSKERKIIIKAVMTKGRLVYEIQNTKSNEIYRKNHKLLTDKPDKTLHGYGVSQVQGITNKYKGIIDIQHNKDEFRIILVI